jgi:hypothetical protein
VGAAACGAHPVLRLRSFQNSPGSLRFSHKLRCRGRRAKSLMARLAVVHDSARTLLCRHEHRIFISGSQRCDSRLCTGAMTPAAEFRARQQNVRGVFGFECFVMAIDTLHVAMRFVIERPTYQRIGDGSRGRSLKFIFRFRFRAKEIRHVSCRSRRQLFSRWAGPCGVSGPWRRR